MNKSKAQKLSPFFILLLSLIAGIYSQTFCAFSFPIVLGTGVSILFLLLLLQKYLSEKFVYFFLIILFFFAGNSLLTLQKKHHKLLLTKYANKQLSVVAYVINKEESQSHPYKHVALLKIKHVTYRKHNQNFCANFKILVYSPFKYNFTVGDTITLNNVRFYDKQTKTLSGNNPFSDYLLKEHVLATIFLNKTILYKITNRPKLSISRWFWEKKYAFYNKLKSKINPKAFAFFSLIFLGKKQQSKNEINLRKKFNIWGLAHYLARSGLHIVIFVLIWKFLFRFIPIHMVIKTIFLVILCLLYSFFSWSSISFLRAYYVFLFLQIGFLMRQQTNFLHLLSIICMFTLLFNPMQLFFLDFQLSFALTFSLVLFSL